MNEMCMRTKMTKYKNDKDSAKNENNKKKQNTKKEAGSTAN